MHDSLIFGHLAAGLYDNIVWELKLKCRQYPAIRTQGMITVYQTIAF